MSEPSSDENISHPVLSKANEAIKAVVVIFQFMAVLLRKVRCPPDARLGLVRPTGGTTTGIDS
ncbi:MAG: hypothetical protein RIG82_10640 [Phycisphaeraceae bacterium]